MARISLPLGRRHSKVNFNVRGRNRQPRMTTGKTTQPSIRKPIGTEPDDDRNASEIESQGGVFPSSRPASVAAEAGHEKIVNDKEWNYKAQCKDGEQPCP